MTDPSENLVRAIGESEELWLIMCKECDSDRVEMLTEAMLTQFGLIMHEEQNANVYMALIGFMAQFLLNVADEDAFTIEGGQMLFQIGVARGIHAHKHASAHDSPDLDS